MKDRRQLTALLKSLIELKGTLSNPNSFDENLLYAIKELRLTPVEFMIRIEMLIEEIPEMIEALDSEEK